METINKIRKIAQIANNLNKDQFGTKLLIKELHATLELSSIDIGFFPKSSFSLAPRTLLHLINTALMLRRFNYLEFGSGISTIYMAKVFKNLGIEEKIVSIDENPEWQKILSVKLKDLGCLDNVKFISAKIDSMHGLLWYDRVSMLAEIISAVDCEAKFNLIMVDGPSTLRDKSIRYNAVPFLVGEGLLSKEFSLFLDDTYRKQEYSFREPWRKLLNCSVKDYDTYTVFEDNTGIITQPIYEGINYRTDEFFSR